MSMITVESSSETTNPLDVVEELVIANDWSFERPSEDELLADVPGRWAEYRLFFLWHEDVSALQFCCRIELEVPQRRRAAVNELLSHINEKLWFGHYEISSEERHAMFRHTSLFRGAPYASAEQIEDMVEIALLECERFYPAFDLVIRGGKTVREAVAAAILDPIGEA